METIAWIGFSQAMFAGIIIGSKKGLGSADKILSAWLILMSIEFATFGLDRLLFSDKHILSNPFLLFNPAIYLYTFSLTSKNFRLRWIQLLHILPYLFFEVIGYSLLEFQQIGNYFEKDSTLWFRFLFAVASFLSWVVYSLLSIFKLHKHRIDIQNEFSTLESYKRISWLLFVLVFYTLYWMTTLGIGVYNFITHKTKYLLAYNYSVLLLLTYILGFYGLKQQAIFKKNGNDNGNEKYKRSRLQDKYKLQVKQKLIEWFDAERPYLDSELNVGKVAENLKISRHELTEVLNTVVNKNFYQFVNEYRVVEVKKMLSNPRKKNISIEAIGFDCGFNSKSTFFSVFKSITGMTPAQFKELKNKKKKLS
jgi:AraC-like DNA-binding protein